MQLVGLLSRRDNAPCRCAPPSLLLVLPAPRLWRRADAPRTPAPRRLDRAPGLDRSRHRGVDRERARGRRRRRRRAGDHPPRHARRARLLDARDRQGHHRGADAGRRLRLAGRRARGLGRPVRHPGGDVAAMAPQTNIGSASPISIGGADIDEVLGRKIENDAAAYVRALAEEHGRNPDLAEEMVREATNVTAAEALDAGLDRPDRHRHRRPARPARRVRRPGPEGGGARHRRARGRGARHAAPVRRPAADRQPERGVPADPRRASSASRSSSSAPACSSRAALGLVSLVARPLRLRAAPGDGGRDHPPGRRDRR